MSDYYSKPPTEAENAKVRETVRKHYGIDPSDDGPNPLYGNRYVRSTGTWYGCCDDCLMWVRDGHAPMESDVSLWIGRWEQNSASDREAYAVLSGYLSAVRDVFAVDDPSGLDDELEDFKDRVVNRDDEPDHKSRCEPLVFKLVHPSEARRRMG